MGGKDHSFDVVYRGETRDRITPGKYVFIQRLKEHGGGYWLGQAYDDCYIFAIGRPVSMREGMLFLLEIEIPKNQESRIQDPDGFSLVCGSWDKDI